MEQDVGDALGAMAAALKQTDGKPTHAAKALGVSRRTLHNKLREYGIG